MFIAMMCLIGVFVVTLLVVANAMYIKGYEAGKNDTKVLVVREKERARVNTLMKMRGF